MQNIMWVFHLPKTGAQQLARKTHNCHRSIAATIVWSLIAAVKTPGHCQAMASIKTQFTDRAGNSSTAKDAISRHRHHNKFVSKCGKEQVSKHSNQTLLVSVYCPISLADPVNWAYRSRQPSNFLTAKLHEGSSLYKKASR